MRDIVRLDGVGAIPFVYTYFTELRDSGAGPKSVLSWWFYNWAASGFLPSSLTVEHAQQHPDYETLIRRVRHLPTVNRPQYEEACFARWIALAAIGGGLMLDIDVLNFGFEREEFKELQFEARNEPLVLDPGGAPGAVLCGSRKSADLLLHEIFSVTNLDAGMTVVNGQEHVSDMTVILRLDLERRSICHSWKENSRLAHFTTMDSGGTYLAKAKLMRHAALGADVESLTQMLTEMTSG